MPKAVKDVDDYRFALVFESKAEGRTEVELFRTHESREARKDNLDAAGINAAYAHVNQTT